MTTFANGESGLSVRTKINTTALAVTSLGTQITTLNNQVNTLEGKTAKDIASVAALYFDPLAGLAAGIIAGALKEVRDRAGFGTPDFRDFIATAAGALVVLPDFLIGG